MMFTPDPLVESWRGVQRPSGHLELELAAIARRGGPLGANEPVPGCDCPTCATYQAGGGDSDAEIAELIVESFRRSPASDREQRFVFAYIVWCELAVTLPPARRLWAMCNPPTRRQRAHRAPLPVEAARATPILDVAERLGLELRRVGRSYRGPCPIHRGEDPNFSVDPERGLFKCFVCDEGGDGIALWMHVRGVTFAEAVREMVA